MRCRWRHIGSHQSGQRCALGIGNLNNAIGKGQHKVELCQRFVVLAIEQRFGGQIGRMERQRRIVTVGRVKAAENIAQATGRTCSIRKTQRS